MSPKLSLEIACNIAIERGGLCLSDKYTNDHSPLLWHCAMGHEWFAYLANIKRKNSWCPQCALIAVIQLKRPNESHMIEMVSVFLKNI